MSIFLVSGEEIDISEGKVDKVWKDIEKVMGKRELTDSEVDKYIQSVREEGVSYKKMADKLEGLVDSFAKGMASEAKGMVNVDKKKANLIKSNALRIINLGYILAKLKNKKLMEGKDDFGSLKIPSRSSKAYEYFGGEEHLKEVLKNKDRLDDKKTAKKKALKIMKANPVMTGYAFYSLNDKDELEIVFVDKEGKEKLVWNFVTGDSEV